MRPVNKYILAYFEPILSFAQATIKPIVNDIASALHINRPKSEFPETIYINSSTACNSSCCFCAYRFLKDTKQIMSWDTFKKTIDNFVNIGGKNVSFTPTIGEPLLDPGLFEKVKYCKEKNLYVVFYTNGILLDKKYKDVLDCNPNDILISLGDVNPRFESEVYGISLEAAKLKISGIIKLIEYKKLSSSKTNIYLGFRNMRPFHLIKKNMDHSIFRRLYPYFKIEVNHAFDTWGDTVNSTSLKGVQKVRRKHKIMKFPCTNLSTLSILPGGEVRLCGIRVKNTIYDDLIIGNINNDSLQNIFNSEKRKIIIENFKKGKYSGPCDNCRAYTL